MYICSSPLRSTAPRLLRSAAAAIGRLLLLVVVVVSIVVLTVMMQCHYPAISKNSNNYPSAGRKKLPELNSSNGSTSRSPGVGGRASRMALGTSVVPISTLSLSLTARKLTASTSRPALGVMGGFMWRSRAHCVARKKGWPLTSLAPALEPNRRFSSLTSSFRIRLLQLLAPG